MSSDKNYLLYIMDQLSEAEEISYRAMMGEFIIYCRGKVIGGIYDNRFLVKLTGSAKRLLPDAPLELPYEGAKKMFLVENTDDRELLAALAEGIADDLHQPKK